jgi:hypothetical protein
MIRIAIPISILARKLVAAIFTGIWCLSSGCSMTNDPAEYTKEMKVINGFAKKIKQQKNVEMRLYGFRCTGPDKVYDGKIHAINLGYSIDKNLKYKEARQFFYELADSLIEEVNSHTELSDLFYHYPISYEDLIISLSFDYDKKSHLKKDDVDSIFIFDNQIYYHIVENEKPKQMIKKEITPEIYILERFETNTRCIVHNLPETD